MTKPVLLDTSCIVALLDRHENFHKEAARVVGSLSRPLITCEAVIAEACYLVRRLPGASLAILENCRKRNFLIPWRLYGHEDDIIALMKKYIDQPMDFADACLVSMAQNFSTPDILTLDHDFLTYRWAGKKKFNVLFDI